MPDLHCVILAAGQGTRMKSRLPKVLQSLAGRPLLRHVIDTARRLSPAGIHVIYGHGGQVVPEAFATDVDLSWVEQAEQLGTGHALQQALPGIPDEAAVLVMYGDVPLTLPTTLNSLRQAADTGLAVLTVDLPDPTGYGRIQRDSQGQVTGIVEHKDADQQQLRIREVNSGLMAGGAGQFRSWLTRVGNDNAQGEYYLTDCVAMAVADGIPVTGLKIDDEVEVRGVNDRAQLAALERLFQLRQANALMAQGLTLMDPARFDLRGSLKIGADCSIDANVIIEGDCELGHDVGIEAGCQLRNVRIGDGSRIFANSVLEDCIVEAQCAVGPFARLRPGARLCDSAKVGNFVEVKKSTLGAGSKANHLAYVGDSEVGEGVNIGAGTITANYDGVNKHKTQIGDGASIGSNCVLVAPVRIGEQATIGAGSVITRDAPDGELTVARARAKTIQGWQRPKKIPQGNKG